MQHLLEKCENIFQNPSKGLHLIRSFSRQIPFDPTHSLQTLHVTRTIPPKLLKFNEHKFPAQLTYINQVNKLTMLFAGVLYFRSNSFQLRRAWYKQSRQTDDYGHNRHFTIKSVILTSKTRLRQTSKEL